VTGLPVYVQNDATSACGAELIFGTGERPKDFLYFYFGTFIGGGLVMNGQLYLGRTGNAAAVGSIQVPAPGGGTRRLIDLASMSVLAEAMEAAGEGSDHLWSQHDRWEVSAACWTLARPGGGGAGPCDAGGGGLLEIEAVLIDGWLPVSVRAEMVRRTRGALLGLDLAGIEPPVIREGTVGADARAWGPQRFPCRRGI
jgi:hypothetical protein